MNLLDKPEKPEDNPLLTFEEGRRLAESGDAKPDYAGDILFDKKYGVFPLTIKDGGVLEANPSVLLDKWDFCMGVLSGLGYSSVWNRIVFVDGCKPRFAAEINVGKHDMSGFRLNMKDNRWYALDSYKSYRERATGLTRMWNALERDIPPRLRDNVIRTLSDFRSLEGGPDGVFTATDSDHNVLRFEIHRDILLRLDDNDKVIGAGLGALYLPSPVTWCC